MRENFIVAVRAILALIIVIVASSGNANALVVATASVAAHSTVTTAPYDIYMAPASRRSMVGASLEG